MKCKECSCDIAHLMIACVQVVCCGYNFCSSVCAEEWLDRQQGLLRNETSISD